MIKEHSIHATTQTPTAAKVIPRIDQRATSRVPVIPTPRPIRGGTLADTRGRRLCDLRISVTDRCNFRCTYCMPKSVFDRDYRFLPRTELLSFEEITRMTRLFATHGVEKIRLTGGEPLLRKNLEVLIEMLAALKTHDGKPLELTRSPPTPRCCPRKPRRSLPRILRGSSNF